MAACVLFWPAVLCPILEIEKFGIRQQSSILGGTIELLKHGNWLVGGVVLLFSVVFPLTKIVLLLELSLLEFLHKRHKVMTLHIMEHVGKWSMMDVMLLAFLVMLVKLGNLVHFEFGPAVFAFILCVAMSMVGYRHLPADRILADLARHSGKRADDRHPVSGRSWAQIRRWCPASRHRRGHRF